MVKDMSKIYIQNSDILICQNYPLKASGCQKIDGWMERLKNIFGIK